MTIVVGNTYLSKGNKYFKYKVLEYDPSTLEMKLEVSHKDTSEILSIINYIDKKPSLWSLYEEKKVRNLEEWM